MANGSNGGTASGGSKRFVYSRAEGEQIAEGRRLATAVLSNWKIVAAAMKKKNLTPFRKLDVTRLGTASSLASGARGTQLNKKTAGVTATRNERNLGETTSARFIDWRDRVKLMAPDAKDVLATLGVGARVRATDTGGLIDRGHAIEDSFTTKGKTGAALASARAHRAAFAKANIPQREIAASNRDVAALAEADTIQMVTKRMAKSGTNAKDAVFAEMSASYAKVSKGLEYLFKGDPETAALFAKQTPKHQVKPRVPKNPPPAGQATT